MVSTTAPTYPRPQAHSQLFNVACSPQVHSQLFNVARSPQAHSQLFNVARCNNEKLRMGLGTRLRQTSWVQYIATIMMKNQLRH